MKLRSYQRDIDQQLDTGASNDLVQLDTGGGKTANMAEQASKAECFIAVAHRNLLITQISATLAHYGIEHNTVSTTYTRRRCIAKHRKQGKEYITTSQTGYVASVDSLISRYKRGRLTLDRNKPWLILIDEAHHVAEANKWFKLQEIFPNARIIGFTATPARLDGKPLGRKRGGLFDRLVQAETLKKDSVNTLINWGYLAEFKLYSFDSDMKRARGRIPINDGEFDMEAANSVAESGKSLTVFGDYIKTYKRLAAGKRAVAMCISIKNAEEIANEFRAAGIPAAHISSDMSATEVTRRFELFELGQIQVLCNVDMIGEGVDVPGIECLIMLRPTASLVAYRQWIGRAMRTADGKAGAIIIDHVGNVHEHGMPNQHVAWSLNYQVSVGRSNTTTCANCDRVHSAFDKHCPECGYENWLMDRSKGLGAGTHHVDTKVIDIQLLEQARSKAEREHQRATEITVPRLGFGGPLEKICEQHRARVIEAAKPDHSIEEINGFLSSQQTKGKSWWLKHFTAADLKAPDTKFIKVFKQWQKSQ